MSPSPAKPRERTANIFINYRREDSAGHAGRLFDALSGKFGGRLFMDVDTLEPGVDFVDAIEQAVGSCEALIVVIGREWLTIADKAGRPRLQDAGDFVRLEIESALARRIRVIPVLVQDAPMPRAEELPPSLAKLARRNAIELSDARWSYDVDRLARTIREVLDEKGGPAPREQPPADPLRAEPRTQSATLRQVPVVSPRPAGGIGWRAWLLSLGAAVLVAAVTLVSLAASGHAPWSAEDRPPVTPGILVAAVPASNGVAIGASTSAANTVPAATAAPVASLVTTDAPPVAQGTAFPDKPPRGLDVKPEGGSAPRIRVVPVATPTPAPVVITPVGSGAGGSTIADSTPASTPVPAPQPARVTILSPQDCEVVGSDVTVQGVVSGLGEHQIFLGIRQANRSIYPRGEIFPNAEGVWSIKLRSSKEKTFDVLVVASTNAEASRVLRDQRSRDDGLAVLPAGAVVGSGVVTLKRQGRIGGILHPRRVNGDC